MNKPAQGAGINGTVCVFRKPVPASEVLQQEVWLKDEEISGEQLFPFLSSKKKRAFLNADILVTGPKFGYGSSMESIVKAIISSGITAIVGENFPPGFFRNAVNLGLPVFIAPGVAGAVKDGDHIEIQNNTQKIIHISSDTSYAIQPLPDFVGKIVEMGGVERYMKEMLREQ